MKKKIQKILKYKVGMFHKQQLELYKSYDARVCRNSSPYMSSSTTDSKFQQQDWKYSIS